MNDVMSGGLHRWWKDEFVRRLGPFATGTRARVLDVAGGTGDTAFRIADLLCHHGVPREEVEGITVCDINEDMLAEGKRRYEAGVLSSSVLLLGCFAASCAWWPWSERGGGCAPEPRVNVAGRVVMR